MEKNEITFFAKTNFRNQDRVFGIKTDDRRRHMYIIGKTGMGKTNLLENMVIQDIRNGHGVCYIDPHGDTAEKLLKAVPSERINDVIYFNPADQQYPIAFNVMESIDPEYRHLVASGLVGVFKKIWADSWGPRLEYILRNAIMALLEYPGSTLLGVTRILVDKKYRERVVEKITDPVIRQFWVDEFPKWSDKVLQEVVSPIQNKVGQFLSNSLIRNIVGQTQSSFDVRQIMDAQKVLIMNLSKGRIGEDSSALLGAMMITKIQLAAMGRVDMNEDDRKDFYLYVDEFQNFATESFANILSEARKYRLNLILANQYIEQIDEIVRNAIFGNAGTLVSFRVGAQDAEFLEKEFTPVFLQNDIVNLQKYNIYLKLMIDGIAGDAFSATTLPPVYIEDTKENEETIIRVSRERYTSDKNDIEEKIARWSGMVLMTNPAPETPLQPRSFYENKQQEELKRRQAEEQQRQQIVEQQAAENQRLQDQAHQQALEDQRLQAAQAQQKFEEMQRLQAHQLAEAQKLQAQQAAETQRLQKQILEQQEKFKAEQLQATEIQKIQQQQILDAQKVQEQFKSPQIEQKSVQLNDVVSDIQIQPQMPSIQQPVQAKVEVPMPEQQAPSISQPIQPLQSPISPALQPIQTVQYTQPVQFAQSIQPTQPQITPAPQPVQVIPPIQIVQPEFDPYANPGEDPYAPSEPPKKPVQDDRPMFDAHCDTCGLDVKVPFKPDGKRPTFCKDCLKDFQRTVAKVKIGEERKAQRMQNEAGADVVSPKPGYSQPSQNMRQGYNNAPRPAYNNASQQPYQKPEKRIEQKAYIPNEKPLMLSQMQHMAPKKFKPRQRPDVNLDEVRNLISQSKEE